MARYKVFRIFKDSIWQTMVKDTKTGKQKRTYFMENEETDRIQRERYLEDLKHGYEPIPEGTTEFLDEYD